MKKDLNAILGAGAFDAFPQALNIWDYYVSHTGFSPGGVDVWLLPLEVLVSCDVLPAWVLLLPLSSQLSFISLYCALFMAHLGYLHLTKASLRCCNSLLRSSGVVQTVSALWVTVSERKIMMIIPLQVLVSMGWFAIHLYAKGTVCLGFDQGIKKRDSPILLITFDSELYTWIYTVYIIQKSCLWACCWMTQVSSTNLYQNLGGEGQT